jgi:hypothetical protein
VRTDERKALHPLPIIRAVRIRVNSLTMIMKRDMSDPPCKLAPS